jgi:toxin CcdB
MARFDVYKGTRASGLLLDIQSDLLDEFGSRVVVPLMPIKGVQSSRGCIRFL